MAQVPIEIVIVGDQALGDVPAAILLANAEQDEFIFQSTSPSIQNQMEMYSFSQANVGDILTYVEKTRGEVRGYHPFIICLIDAAIDGKRFSNLFGSARSAKGIAVVTTSLVSDVIVPRDKMAAYFIYNFARYTMHFLAPTARNHDDPRGCVYDRQIDKRDILKSMKARALCDECRRVLLTGEGMLSARQFGALDRLFSLAGKVITEGIRREERPKIFIGSSTEGIKLANKLQEMLASEFSVIVWNQGTVFGLGTSTLEALEAAVLEFQHGIFVFTPDDELHMRGEVKAVSRDNVLFELGMFIGKLGRKKAFVVHPGRQAISLPSDLAGLTTAPYEPNERNLAAALGPVANRIREAVRGA